MAGYGYINKFRETELRDNGDGVNKAYSDHICRPVVIDAQGRKHPIVRYTNGVIPGAETVVTKTETYVDHLPSPLMSPYRQDPYKQQEQIHRTTIHHPLYDQQQIIHTGANPSPYWRAPKDDYKTYDYNTYDTNDDDNASYYYKHQVNEIKPDLTKPTSDINAAMNLLVSEAAPGLKSRFHFGVPVTKTTVTTTETISSSEAKRRYGSASPYNNAEDMEDYSGVIDSREAIRRYHGSTV